MSVVRYGYVDRPTWLAPPRPQEKARNATNRADGRCGTLQGLVERDEDHAADQSDRDNQEPHPLAAKFERDIRIEPG